MSELQFTAAVITVSDKGARGEREDTSGPALCQMLREQGWQIIYTAIVPDEQEAIKRELIACADEKRAALVLTTGGTGFSPRDVTPEATLEVVERLAPGILKENEHDVLSTFNPQNIVDHWDEIKAMLDALPSVEEMEKLLDCVYYDLDVDF